MELNQLSKPCNQQEIKVFDQSIIGLLHFYVSLGILILCLTFIIKTWLVHDYVKFGLIGNVTFILVSGMIFISLISFVIFVVLSAYRVYILPISNKKYAPLVFVAGIFMIGVFVAFSFLNPYLKIFNKNLELLCKLA